MIRAALHTALNELGHPVMLLTEDGTIVQANDAAARVTGRTAESMVGTHDCPFLLAGDSAPIAPGFLAYVATTGKRADREVRRFNRWWQLHLVPVDPTEHRIARVLLLAQDITSVKIAQAEAIESEKSRTLTRVREVHHRVKNHLQGLIGLLRSCSNSDLPGGVIDTAVARILAIATVHGLLAEDGQSTIEFADLLEQIVASQRLSSPIPLQFSLDRSHWEATPLSQEETIPLAVALGELLTNAIKHTPVVPAAYVAGTLLRTGDEVELIISNGPSRLPTEFNVSGATGSRAGLVLVQTLLMRNKSHLEIFQDGERVTARLRVRIARP